jgi:hypothetical protein
LDAVALVRIRVSSTQAVTNDVQICLGLTKADSILQPAKTSRDVLASLHDCGTEVLKRMNWHIHITGSPIIELCRDNADHLEGVITQREILADDIRIGIEAVSPECFV